MPAPVSGAPRVIRAAAPIRICDNGGWTDTWFARHGCVFNLAVSPCVEVDVRIVPAGTPASMPPAITPASGVANGRTASAPAASTPAGSAPTADARTSSASVVVIIHAENFGPPYVRDRRRAGWDRHPLIEAAIEASLEATASVATGGESGVAAGVAAGAKAQAEARADVRAEGLPAGCCCEVTVHAEVPPGASVGSSASTIVAILGALRRLTGVSLAPADIAAAAHRIETERLGRQSGIQDQLAAAYGGASFIEMSAYPDARVTPLPLPDDLRWELDARLSLVYLGRSHESSGIHDRVIRGLEAEGPDAPPLRALRQAATAARDAFTARDFAALGRAFQANTDAQAALHADLVGLDAWRVIDIARAHGALGWKVNGAGGDGGSLAILGGPSRAATRAMRRAIAAEDASFRLLPIHLSPAGLRVWESS